MSFIIKNGTLLQYKAGKKETEIEIPDGVTDIFSKAFAGCKNLISVSIPDSVQSVGNYAFSGCTNLKTINVSSKFHAINSFMAVANTRWYREFQGDFVVLGSVLLRYQGTDTDVTVPEAVTEIGDNAFYQCAGLISIHIPESVKSIGNWAFSGCINLKTIDVSGESHAINSSNAVADTMWYRLYKGDFIVLGSVLLRYRGTDTDVTIPQTITKIGDYAFYQCWGLTSVTIPDSVTSIGSAAFSECYNLFGITIPDSVTRIENEAFKNCARLTRINIPGSVKSIGSYAFSGCKNLVNIRIPGSVTSIGSSVFSGCIKLSDITIPDGAASIGRYAFDNCQSLTRIYIPDSVTSIGDHIFSSCTNLETIDVSGKFQQIDSVSFLIDTKWLREYKGDYIILGCVLLYYKGTDNQLIIPEQVSVISSGAFAAGQNANRYAEFKSVIIPENVKIIEDDAFKNFSCISSMTIPDGLKVGEIFGDNYPDDLALDISHFTEAALKKYLPSAWKRTDPEQLAQLYLTKYALYKKVFNDFHGEELNTIGEEIAKNLKSDSALKICSAAGNFIKMYYKKVKVDVLRSIYEVLKHTEKGTDALKALADEPAVMKVIGTETFDAADLNPIQKITAENNEDDLYRKFKDNYAVSINRMPPIKSKDGKILEKFVTAWLFLVDRNYEKPGISDKADKVVDMLDQKTFQDALMQIAQKYLGTLGSQRYLAFPLCRYADEEVLAYMCKTAPSWRSGNSGIESPPLREFRKACKYSTLIQAAFFAEKYNDLDAYASIRDTDAETIRDTMLSDTGLCADGTKKYDIGNQSVTARLQSDLSFLIEAENGKTSKAIPKKGADEKLYAQASADFSNMKKMVKKIIKNRFSNLFRDFLTGKEKNAESWKKVYFNNPVLKHVAMLVVWSQGQQTFLMTDNGLIDSSEQQYDLQDIPVTVAYPTEMWKDDIKRWQKYFADHHLKQPFQQIWEPVIDPKTVKADRYSDSEIPFYRFTGQEKHGIYVTDHDFHRYIEIKFSDIDVETGRLDFLDKHTIRPEDCFCITSVKLHSNYSRMANHQIAYLDRITLLHRVRNDDITVQSYLSAFTFAQITEFIQEAEKAHAVNVLAVLMDFKNRNFSDYNVMDKFELNW